MASLTLNPDVLSVRPTRAEKVAGLLGDVDVPWSAIASVTVEDDGRGLPSGFDVGKSTSLGLSIVRTLVESELDGRLEVGAGPGGGGTRVTLELPL